MDPQLIIFAIESAVRLGRKVNEVLVDQTAHRPLLLPVGDLFQSVDQTIANDFFLDEKNAHLVDPGGPYEGATNAEKLLAYKTLMEVDRRLDPRQLEKQKSDLAEAKRLMAGLGKFEQVKREFAPNSPARRIVGTVVEIGIDYFSANPQALERIGGKDSRAVQVVKAFVGGLTETDFAEASLAKIAGDVLGAALQILGNDAQLVTDDERLKVLLTGIATSLAEEIDEAPDPGTKESRAQFFRRIGTGVVRGAATAFEQNVDLFLPRAGAKATDPDHPLAVRAIVSGTLTQFLAGIEGNEDIFTTESIEVLLRSALGAVGENTELLIENDLLREFVSATTESLTNTQGAKLFSTHTVAVILREGLEVLGENVETLVDPENPQQQLLATALSAMAHSLATNLAGRGDIKELLSARQLTQLAQIVFAEVAAHPEQLLGENLDDNRRTVLAQIIASVAKALGEEPTRLVNGASFLQLVRIALNVAVKNADQLINLESSNPNTNLLFKVLKQTADGILESDSRKIVSREVFVEVVQRLLPVASANLDLLIEGKPLVALTVSKVLALADGSLKTRINGATLPLLLEELLGQVLSGELKLTAATDLKEAAITALANL